MPDLLESPIEAAAIAAEPIARKSPRRSPSAPVELIAGLSLCGLMLAWLLRSTLADLYNAWQLDPNVSHGPLVVLAALAMAAASIRQESDARQTAKRRLGAAQCLTNLALSWSLYCLGWFVGSLLLSVIGIILLLRATAVAWAGEAMARRLSFPLWFLICAAPLPIAWHQAVSHVLQQVASVAAEEGLSLLGIATLRSGNILQLSGFVLEVGEACSGLRQLTAMLALAAGVGYFAGQSFRYRFALVALAIPVAILANCLRAILTGLILVTAGTAWAEGAAHALEGLGMAALGGALLLGLAGLLKRFDRPRGAESRTPLPTSGRVAPTRRNDAIDGGSPPLARAALFTAALAACTLLQTLLARHLEAAGALESSPIYSSLAALPLELGAWRGEDLPIRDPRWKFADEHLQRVYRHVGTGQAVWVWSAYSTTGADRGHHPEVCLAVAGKREDPQARAVVELTGAGPGAQEYRFFDEAQAQRVLYWHYSLSSPDEDRLDAAQRAYRRLHYRPASVTVETIGADGSAADRAALRYFAVLLDAALRGQIVGPSAVRGSRRTSVAIVHP